MEAEIILAEGGMLATSTCRLSDSASPREQRSPVEEERERGRLDETRGQRLDNPHRRWHLACKHMSCG